MPFQKKGKIEDETVETIDILSAFAGAPGDQTPWKTQGVSVLSREQRTVEVLVTTAPASCNDAGFFLLKNGSDIELLNKEAQLQA